MVKFVSLGLATLAIAFASSAKGADLPVRPPIFVQQQAPWNWTGFYLGGHFGGAYGNAQLQDPFGAVSYGDSVTTTSFIAGGQAGANYQIGNWVIGGAADVSWATSRGDETCFGLSGGQFYASNCSVDPNLYSTFTGRFGYAFGHTLVYAKGGAAWEHDNVAMAVNANPGNHYIPSANSYGEWGWTLGAGIEYALTPAWSLFAEYDYLNFASHSVSTPYQPGNPLPGHPVGPIAGLSNDVHQFKLGLNYRIGADPILGLAALPLTSLKSPLSTASGWEIEGGIRDMYSWGRAQWEQAPASNPKWFNSSKLTWSNMQTDSVELFGRLDTPWNIFLNGFVGVGDTLSGDQNDEDFDETHPHRAYNNTSSSNNGNINYAVVDLGYDALHNADFKLGPFVGYTVFNQNIFKEGCQQVANPSGNCSLAGYSAPIPSSQLIGLENMTWQALRVGLSGQIYLFDRVKLTADAAYLPYVTYNWLDDHLGRNEQWDMSGHGIGVQMQAVLSYDLTDQLSIGVGGRYWAMWSTSAQRVYIPAIPGIGAEPNRNSVELAGVFVQAAYRFDPDHALAGKSDSRALPIFKGPAEAPIYNWTGLHAGIEGGGVFGDSLQIGQPRNRSTADATPTFAVNGGMAGGTIGYNSQVNQIFVAGLEGDMSWVDANGSAGQIAPFATSQTASTRELWLGTARARIGVTPMDRWLVYATAGLALSDVAASITNANGTIAFPSESHIRPGWTAGAGVEVAITGNWSTKLEYLHVGLENHAYFVPTPNNPAITNRAGGVTLNDNILRAGLNYKIDW